MRTAPGGVRDRIAYVAFLLVAGAWATVTFIRPAGTHNGLNQYEPSAFLRMVDGTASRPYVYRTLLPSLVRAGTRVTPAGARERLTRRVEGSSVLRRAFEELHWETSAAWQYLLATTLMWFCFAGFGHAVASLTLRVYARPPTLLSRAGLAVSALACVLPVFTYNSFPYDPPQLLLFALALDALAAQDRFRFTAVFLACCLNKETAILLVPVFHATSPGGLSRGGPWRVSALLVGLYAAVRAAIVFAFRNAPGGVVEVHALHTLRWLTHGWNFYDLSALLVVAGLLAYGWREKPRFLRIAFLGTLPPLLLLASVFGFVDEWRDYYEAYPVAFALAFGTVLRLRAGAESPGR